MRAPVVHVIGLAVMVNAAYLDEKVYAPNTPLQLFDALDCAGLHLTGSCQCSSTIPGAKIVIQEGTVNPLDAITCSGCETRGMTLDWDGSGGVLTIAGSNTIDEYIAALKTAEFVTSDSNGNERLISWNFGEGAYRPDMGRFYEFFTCQKAFGKASCSWTEAQSFCSDPAHDVLGLAGYLATITSTEELDALHYLHPDKGGWIGASDAGEDGEWRWVVGPEGCPDSYDLTKKGPYRTACLRDSGKGQLIGKGAAAGFKNEGAKAAVGSPPDWVGGYDHFSSTDPKGGSNEDFAHMKDNAYWYDSTATNTEVTGFACEWGGVGVGEMCMEVPDGEVLLKMGCAHHTTEGACENGKPSDACEWDGGACVMGGCHKHPDVRSCNHDALCAWDISKHTRPAGCVAERCHALHKSSSTCKKDYRCGWNTVKGECEELICQKITDQCDCLAHLPVCDWVVGDGFEAHCAPKMHCPASDIMFLVPATPLLAERWGVYKKGHDGMLEQFRHWEKQTELSKDEKSPGLRMSFMTYGTTSGGEYSSVDAPDSFKARCQNNWEEPPSGGTGGVFSGDQGTLSDDLDFHESLFCKDYAKGGTYAADAMKKAGNAFTTVNLPNGEKRNKYVFLVSDTPLADRAEVLAAKVELEQKGIKVFALALSQSRAGSALSEQTKKSLSSIVTEPIDTHIQTVVLDDLEKTLNDLCDPHGHFGVQVFKDAHVDKPCEDLYSQVSCQTEGDKRCQWDLVYGECIVSKCHPLCTETSCNDKLGCEWNTDKDACIPRYPECSATNERDCETDELCTWDPAWKDGCTFNPCALGTGSSEECRATTMDIGVGCSAQAGDPEFCLTPVCNYESTSNPTCAPKPCTATTEARCKQDDRCLWQPTGPVDPTTVPARNLADYCRWDRCHQYAHSSWQCNNQDSCEYSNGDCVEKSCAKYRNLRDCAHNAACKWDVENSECVDEPCAFVTDCDKNENCMKNNHGDCVQKVCLKHKENQCMCTADPECVWVVKPGVNMPHNGYCVKPSMASCPDVDIAMLLDGSGSMRNTFGSYSHGFYGLCEIMREWVLNAPLSGDDHTVGKDASPGGFRVAFLQFAFSKRDYRFKPAHPSNCGVGECTDGKLSGRFDELALDLDWHEDNYQRGWTYLYTAFTEAADLTFLPENSPHTRKHIVMVFADGGLTDYDGDACCNGACPSRCKDSWYRPEFEQELMRGQGKLFDEKVDVFGIVLRRKREKTFQDENAFNKLAPLVSEPTDTHILSVYFDHLKDEILDTLCDATSPFGENLVPPVAGALLCNGWALPDECNADEHCQWVEPQQTECKDKPDACPNLGCRNVPPDQSALGFGCDQCKLERSVITCGLDVEPNTDGFCDNSKCMSYCDDRGDQKQCKDDPDCFYSTDEKKCLKVVCEADPMLAEEECKKNPVCTFVSSTTCVKKVCESQFIKENCTANDECWWDDAHSPPLCRPVPTCTDKDKTECKTDSSCTWECTDNDNGKCVDTYCPYPTDAECVADTDCEWTTSGCFLKPCYNSRASSAQEKCKSCDDCRWKDGPPTECVDDHCKDKSKGDCDADKTCLWDTATNTCVTEPCADLGHGTDAEGKCEGDKRCDWDKEETPAMCLPNVCKEKGECGLPHNDATPVDVNPRCKQELQDGDLFCVEKECGNETSSCYCAQMPGCFWDKTSASCKEQDQAHCPDFDLVVLLDGSKVMKNAQGKSPSGFQGENEVLRDYMTKLPLTGSDAAKTGGQVRVAFRTFSADTKGVVCPDAGCAGASPTGDLAKLNNELDWHNDQYDGASEDRYLVKAFNQAVADLKAASDPGHPRVKVVLVILGDEPSDAAGLPAAKAAAEADGVAIYGRAFKTGDAEGKSARDFLKTFVSTYGSFDDHLKYNPLKDGVYNRWCNPISEWGASLHSHNEELSQPAVHGSLPCEYWTSSLECRADTACDWEEPGANWVCDNGGCPQINCLSLTPHLLSEGLQCSNCQIVGGRVSCKAEWDFPTPAGRCQMASCAPKCFGPCFNQGLDNEVCDWAGSTCSEVVCNHEMQDDCEADDLCKWNTTVVPAVCVRKPCTHFTSGACLEEEGCDWDKEKGECFEKDPDCEEIATDLDCTAHQSGKCEWDCSVEKKGCMNNPCYFKDATGCGTNTVDCLWEEDKCRRKHCIASVASEAECTLDPPCRWNAPDTCTENICHKHQHESTCQENAKCKWDAEGCGACIPTRCSELHPTQNGCGDEESEMCRWDADRDACVDLKCKDYTTDKSTSPIQKDLCDCRGNPECVVTPDPARCTPKRFAACPDLDLMVALPGQCTMQERFGKHSNGYETLVAGVSRFLEDVPLTGEAAGAPSTSTARLVRVGLQLADKGARLPECPACACSPDAASHGAGIPSWSTLGDSGVTGADECGQFSGKWDELHADMLWAQGDGSNAAPVCRGRDAAVLKETYEHALTRFKAAPNNRKRVLFLVTDAPVTDNAELVDLKKQLQEANVLVFAVYTYGRRGPAATAEDMEDYAALESAIPASGLAQQLTVDGAVDALNGLCNKETLFGQKVADPQTPVLCSEISNSMMCMDDRRCDWDSIQSACADHPCTTHCQKLDCEMDTENKCKFDEKTHTCGKTLCEEADTKDECDALECRWDSSKVPECQVTECPADTEDACWLLPNDCEWQIRDGGVASCEKIPCNHNNEADCTADIQSYANGCDWVDSECGGVCFPKKCTSVTSSADCTGFWDQTCEYTGSCQSKECTNIRNETCCEAKEGCTWHTDTTSPGSCTMKKCGAMDPKKDEPECQKCTDLDQCACKNDPKCWFDAAGRGCISVDMGLCPNMDVVVMLDSEKSMGEEFGRHPHGFNALVEMVREWSEVLPLTKVGTTKTNVPEGSQISVVQFSGVRGVMADAWATNFTGMQTEVESDLDAHVDKWATTDARAPRDSMVAQGLTKAAAQYSDMKTVADRKRVVVMFLNEKGEDDSAALENMIQVLKGTGAVVLGVALRRQELVMPADVAAKEQLVTITGSPERVQELTIYDVYEQVFLDLCKPDGKFGKEVKRSMEPPQACSLYTDAVRCNMDEGCTFDSTTSQCVANVCSKRCTETECKKPLDSAAAVKPECEWRDPGECWEKKECQKVENQTACDPKPECEWVPGVGCVPEPCTPNTNEQECVQDQAGCEWDPDQSPSCIKACDWETQDLCIKHPECEWKDEATCTGEKRGCTRKKPACSDNTDSDSCGTAPVPNVCVWEDATCSFDQCGQYTSEQCCDDATSASCQWDVSTSPPVCGTEPCSKKDMSDCPDSGECEMKGDKCVPKDCDGKDSCNCANAVGCFWVNDPGTCVNEAYGQCPPTDYVVLVDGSNVMGESFSRHPQGFYAVMAQLQEWVGDIPLTDPTAPAKGSLATDSRVAVVRYVGVGGTSSKTYTSPTAKLDGTPSSLEQDLDWHATDFSSVTVHGDGMLEAGLAKAADILAAGNTAERRSAVIVISGEEFTDTSAPALVAAQSKLNTQNAKVFGIALRRGASSTPADTGAESALKKIASAPVDSHVVNIEVDDLVPTLMSLCSKTETWGQALRAAPGNDLSDVPGPCVSLEKAACNDNMRCVWSETSTKCADSPCVSYCDKDPCNADTANMCHFDDVTKKCERFPPPNTDCECHIDSKSLAFNEEQCKLKTDMYACVWDDAKKECTKDDCMENVGEGWKTCSGKAQVCRDNNNTACEADWVCDCPDPQTLKNGEMLGPNLAVCELDECVADCPTCHGTLATCGANQTCVDKKPYDPASLRDWECVCSKPFDGVSTASAATCLLDECVGHEDCDWCEEGKICPRDQICKEPNRTKVGDWVCACPPPMDKKQVMGPVDHCDFDECEIAENKALCESNNQTCFDHVVSERNVWMCKCKEPLEGNQTVDVAVCFIDECEKTCPTCENDACSENQTCVDTNRLPTPPRDWKCVCDEPTRGDAVGAPATCVLDECKETCSTCELGECPLDQTCHDPHTTPDKRSDWYCQCKLPSTTINITNAVLVCEYNECSVAENEQKCTNASQICKDTNPTLDSQNDWECHCVSPPAEPNSTVMGPTECHFKGECEPGTADSNAEAVQCTTDGHVCQDWDLVNNDPPTFSCECLPPTTPEGGKNFNRTDGVPYTSDALNCTLDECATVCDTCLKKHDSDEDICSLESGQQCVDRDHKVFDSWQCECVGDAKGTEGRPATCEIDECADDSLNDCAQDQECTDTEKSVDGTGNYKCTCKGGEYGVGETTGAAATCVCDECEILNGPCQRADALKDPPVVGQSCFDAVQTCPAASDYVCTCGSPFLGNATAANATCKVNECDKHRGTCEAEEQECKDPDEGRLGDWYCECLLPATGKQTGDKAECHLNECNTSLTVGGKTGDEICGDNQTCIEGSMDSKSTGDWKCKCQTPDGTTADVQRADCVVDECEESGGQAPNSKCRVDCGEPDSPNCQQTCFDPPERRASNMSNWVCLCPPGSVTVSPGLQGPATCAPPDPCDCQTEDCCLTRMDVCDWSCDAPQKCSKKPCPGTSKDSCELQSACTWAQAGGGSPYVPGVPLELLKDVTCAAAGTQTLTVTVTGGYVSGKDAVVCPGCPSEFVTWNPDTGVLTSDQRDAAIVIDSLKKITFETSSRVGAPRTLTWSVGSCSGEVTIVRGYCEPKRCEHAMEGDCKGDAFCSWVANKCEVNHCGQHPSEVLCMADPQCFFDTSECPVVCKEKYCPATHTTNGVSTADQEKTCDEDPRCRPETVDGKKTCVEKFCNDITDNCKCHEDPDCYWRKGSAQCVTLQYGSCATLDAVVLVGGSASMGMAFGRHPNGFYAVAGALQTWATELPLSGVKAGQDSPAGSNKTRVAFVQYGAGALSPDARVSGDLDEVNANLDKMKEDFMSSSDNSILDALTQAHQMLKTQSPQDGRKRAVFILADSEVNDGNQVAGVLRNLKDLGTEVFGVVLRKGAVSKDKDQKAEASLLTLTTEPQDLHVVNIEIDVLTQHKDDSPLKTICDPTAHFGQFLVDRADDNVPCFQHKERDVCINDIACAWGEAGQTCGPTPCLQNCGQEKCEADTLNNCTWDAVANDCFKVPPCYAETQGDCPEPDCVWDGMAAVKCKVNPCGHTTETGCLDQLEPLCEWDCSTSRCSVKKCLGVDEGACTGESGCTWYAPESICHVTPCIGASGKEDCEADKRCSFNNGACQRTTCGQHPTDAGCRTSSECKFEAAACPAACVEKACATTPGYCQCSDVTETKAMEKGFDSAACMCNEDPDCFWRTGQGCVDSQYGVCPTLDAVVLFDGSAAMGQAFGGSTGYDAVIATLKDWVDELPLSKEKAGATPTADSKQTRLAFVQVSDAAQRAAAGAKGQLSGDKLELEADLDWHKDNMLGQGRSLEAALNTAKNILAPANSPNDGRRRAVFIVVSGPAEDNAMLMGAAEALQNRAEVYVVVTRRSDVESADEAKAATELRLISSRPQDVPGSHFTTVPMSEFGSERGPLTTICNPDSSFGQYLADAGAAGGAPCHLHESFQECETDVGCVYNEAKVTCENTPCLDHCGQAQCDGDAACAWDGAQCLKKPPCPEGTQGACDPKDMCEWVAGAPDTCVVDPCALKTEDACVYQEDPKCEFKEGKCTKKKCVSDDEGECRSFPVDDNCEYVDGKCKVKCSEPSDNTCACLDETECTGDVTCFWDIDAAPAVCTEKPCTKKHMKNGALLPGDESKCNDDPECVVDEITDANGRRNICRSKTCNDISSDKCACHTELDGECYWIAEHGTCVDKQYGLCPTLDIVVLFDGSGSMVKQFGRHPNGYAALMSVFQQWLSSLPLSGEKADEGSSALTDKVRVAFVQYSGTYDSAKKAQMAPPGDGRAGGRLSGDLAELMADVQWHTENHMAKQTFIQQGLDMTADILSTSPQDGRKRAVYVIGDGKLDDSSKVASKRDALMLYNPEVFAIEVRRTATNTDFDQEALASLATLTTAPQENHVISLEMDDLYDPLSRICDPTSEFGKYLADPKGMRPCHQYAEAEAPACVADMGCIWDPNATKCSTTPCLEHCDKSTCEMDTGNKCQWNVTVGGECYTTPDCMPPTNDTCVEHNENRRACVKDGCVWQEESLACVWHACAQNCDEDKCMADEANNGANTCTWDMDAAQCNGPPLCEGKAKGDCPDVECMWEETTMACVLNPCGHTTEDACLREQDPECIFTSDDKCVLKPCQFDTEGTCNQQDNCEWDTDKCVEKCTGPSAVSCECQRTDGECGAQPGCIWDASVLQGECKEDYCRTVADRELDGTLKNDGEKVCNNDNECIVKTVDNRKVCLPRLCSDESKACMCEEDADCAWMAGGDACTAREYGTCPTLDAVVVFSGGAELKKRWMRHPDGYSAVVDTLRSWVKNTPLSGEKAGATSVDNGMMRLGFVQYGSDVAQSVKARTTPSQKGTAGRLSGDVAELVADLDWHVDNQLDGQGGYIRDAIFAARGMLEESSASRNATKAIYIVADNKIEKDDLGLAKTLLAAMSVKVFGIVVMEGTIADTAANAAESTVGQLVPKPVGENLKKVPMDTFASKTNVLTTICDPQSDFGKTVARPTTACTPHCEKTCVNADDCLWVSEDKECVEKDLCDEDSESTCPTPACMWLQREQGEPHKCERNPCNGLEEKDCDQYACEWDSDVCKFKECQYDTKELCNEYGDKEGCIWYSDRLPEGCDKKRCTAGTESVCVEDSLCMWDSDKCTVKPCTHHGTLEDCQQEPGCEWDVESASEPVCVEEYCRAKYASSLTEGGDVSGNDAACTADPKCVTKKPLSKTTCLSKKCSDAQDQCACLSEDDCFWAKGSCVNENQACPSMDIIVLFDGSGTMSQKFGHSKNGFISTLETLKLWVTKLPLTNSASQTAPGTRVAFMQFSGEWEGEPGADVWVTPAGTGTGGQFSGTQQALLDDLSYHEQNFYQKQTYIVDGLNLAAETFEKTSPKDGRKHVLFVISDGKFNDESYITAPVNALHAQDVEVYGIVLEQVDDNGDKKTKENADATASMRKLVDEPKDGHMQTLDMDTLVTLGPLGTLCEPNSKFGKYLMDGVSEVPCSAITEVSQCRAQNSRERCSWTNGKCEDACSYCAQDTCVKDNACRWSTEDAECYVKDPCLGKDEMDCPTADCVWQKESAVCVWNPCATTIRNDCQDDSNCTWTDAGECVVTPCTYTEEALCSAAVDEHCVWVSESTCEQRIPCDPKPDNYCYCKGNDRECYAAAGCEWNITKENGFCEETHCRKHYATGEEGLLNDEAGCGNDPKCRVVAKNGVKTCEPNSDCSIFDTSCSCYQNDGCFWRSEEEKCVSEDFGACPPLDMVMLFDGSGSMAQDFGHHPHGFYALIETLKMWASGMPLSGDAAGARASDDGTRVAFVQYSGVPLDKEARVTPPNVGTGGRFSGNLDELTADLEWHEDNFLAQQTFISGGLTKSAALLEQSPVGRKRVLVVISDGGFNDRSLVDGIMKEIDDMTPKPEVFGIVVRRNSEHDPKDKEAMDDMLDKLATEDHAINIAMDDLASATGPLSRLCNPNDNFGKFLVPERQDLPCPFHDTEDRCSKDTGCSWTNNECKRSACLLNCGESDCADDCTWADGTCISTGVCAGKNMDDCTSAELKDDCKWRSDTCVPRGPPKSCNERDAKDDCEDDGMCQWDAPSSKCRIHKNRGDCAGGDQCGNCICNPGWSGPDCGVCTTGLQRDTVDGVTTVTCPACGPESCSGNGVCDVNGMCVCNAGFIGVDCAARMSCAPLKAHWAQSYPNQAIPKQLTSIIVHGCYNASAGSEKRVKLVKGDGTYQPYQNFAEDVCNTAVPEGCTAAGERETLTLGGACDVVEFPNAVLASTGRELIVNMTVADNMGVHVCWYDGANWVLAPGQDIKTATRVTQIAFSDEGIRGAADGPQQGGVCCEGWRVGSACLPSALVVAVFCIFIAGTCYVAFELCALNKQLSDHSWMSPAVMNAEQPMQDKGEAPAERSLLLDYSQTEMSQASNLDDTVNSVALSSPENQPSPNSSPKLSSKKKRKKAPVPDASSGELAQVPVSV